MIKAGVPVVKAAAVVGMEESALGYHARAAARESGTLTIKIALNAAQAESLTATAAEYGRTPSELAASILSIVIADKLIKAVIG